MEALNTVADMIEDELGRGAWAAATDLLVILMAMIDQSDGAHHRLMFSVVDFMHHNPGYVAWMNQWMDDNNE